MRKENFPAIVGFEWYPNGRLLMQAVDFTRAVGIAYERCIGFDKPEHTHDRFAISFARGSSRSEIHMYDPYKLYRLDASRAHLMPVDLLHKVTSSSSVYDTFALYVDLSLLDKIFESLGLTAAERKAFTTTTQMIPRTAAMDDLVERYFFARILCPTSSPAELTFLENELLSLVVLTALDRKTPKAPALTGVQTDEIGLARALQYIETNLFDPGLAVESIVNFSRASQATLFRQFRKELGATPFSYVRNRRLDESLPLLRRHEYSVQDVAHLVGYEDLSAFSKAFKKRFNKNPSQELSA